MTDAKQQLAEAIALHRQGDAAAAESLYRAVLAVRPDDYDALHLLGVALHQQGEHAEAIAFMQAALAVHDDDPSLHGNLAAALQRVGRPGDALASADRALAMKRDWPLMHRRRGDILLDLSRADEALASLDRALALEPSNAATWNLRGVALGELMRHDEAIASFERALAIDSRFHEARFNRGSALLDARRYGDAAQAFADLERVAPAHPFVRGQRLHAQMLACDWSGLDALVAAVDADVDAGRPSAEPFGYQAIATSPARMRRCAEIYAHSRFPERTAAWHGERYVHQRIRVGYVSGEFREQATAILMAELYELHDRARFEIHAFDNGFDDGSALRRRLANAVDSLTPIAALDDAAAARAIRERGIDILVNLNGWFGRLRQGVFALRPAPVQVNYLGFPGTLGAQCIDYILADATVIPHGEEDAYVERVVRLPHSYQPNDSQRPLPADAPTRAQVGLPEHGFVFCCFNNNYKILPPVFDTWMRLLRAVDDSVLWLFGDNVDAVANLRREAVARGIDARRIVFAPRVPPEAHLARHRLADLFLDTLPSNAHTTASDALWAGLPLVTIAGPTFPGRVATSLLRAARLPELSTASLAEYEALALALARSPDRLSALRERLQRARTDSALFDSRAYCRALESAYATMAQRARDGDAPIAFDVSS